MALHGKIISLGQDRFGFEYVTGIYDKPEIMRQIWAIESLRTSGMSYCRNDEAIGKPASVSDGKVSCYLGNGNYVSGPLVDGGSSKSVSLEITPAPRPRCKSELRWYQGSWQKYSARKGWIAA